MASLPVGTPLPLLVALAVAIGLSVPPLGACVRSLLPSLVPDPSAAPAVYAVETSAVEFTWVVGPPLALGLAAAALHRSRPRRRRRRPRGRDGWPSPWSPRRAPGGPSAGAGRPRGGALRVPGDADARDRLRRDRRALSARSRSGRRRPPPRSGAARPPGPLLGLWGLGSLAGGVITARLGGGARGAAGLSLVLAGLAAGHIASVAATGSLVALGAVLLVAGAALAPPSPPSTRWSSASLRPAPSPRPSPGSAPRWRWAARRARRLAGVMADELLARRRRSRSPGGPASRGARAIPACAHAREPASPARRRPPMAGAAAAVEPRVASLVRRRRGLTALSETSQPVELLLSVARGGAQDARRADRGSAPARDPRRRAAGRRPGALDARPRPPARRLATRRRRRVRPARLRGVPEPRQGARPRVSDAAPRRAAAAAPAPAPAAPALRLPPEPPRPLGLSARFLAPLPARRAREHDRRRARLRRPARRRPRCAPRSPTTSGACAASSPSPSAWSSPSATPRASPSSAARWPRPARADRDGGPEQPRRPARS